MPPYTRRSSGWTNNGSETPGREGGGGGPNIEYFLEHLEQFKRKHISQNRDIIKSNAFLQLRIRDLESRIQSMEVDKHQNYRAIARLKYELHQASHQGSVNGRDIWLELGKSMGFLDQEAGSSGSAIGKRLRRPIVPPMASVRIELDPESLPGGVVRAIARAPGEEGILEESEDEAMEESQHQHAGYEEDERLYQRSHVPVEYGGSATSSLAASPAASLLLHEEPLAPASPEPERIALPEPAPSRSASASQWTSFLPPVSNGESSATIAAKPKKSEAMKGKKLAPLPSSTSQRQDKLSAKSASAGNGAREQPRKPASVVEQEKPQARSTFREGLDEEMEDAAEVQSKRAPRDLVMADSERVPNGRESSKQRVSSASSSKTLVNSDEPSPSRTTSRKRKPSSGRDPTILTDVTSLALPTYSDPIEDVYDTPATDEEDAPAASGGRSSRRSSVRARPSINYALPKLNTKMRKPDPEEVRGTGGLSSAALNGPATLVGTGEGEANGDLRDIKRERQMRQGVSAASSAARKSSAPRPAKSRTSKSGGRSRLNGDAGASEDDEADGDDERGRSSALNSELESSADERESEHATVPTTSAWSRQSVNGDRRRTNSHTPISYQESEDEGEDTIVASAPPAASSILSGSGLTRSVAAAAQSTDSDEEIEVARSAAEHDYDEDGDGDITMPVAISAPARAPASASNANGPSARVQAPLRAVSAGSAATSSKRPLADVATSGADGAAAIRERSVSANAVLPSAEQRAPAGKTQSAGTTPKPAASSASASKYSSSGSSQAPASAAPSSTTRPSSSSSSTSASRPSLSSSSISTSSSSNSSTSKRPFSSSGSGALTDADLALLAQSTSSLADLTSASAWPSTPQVGGGGAGGFLKGGVRAGAGGQGGLAGGKKVSTLSRFSNAPKTSLAAGTGNGVGGGVGVGAQGRSLGKIKPFNLSASSSLNGGAGVAVGGGAGAGGGGSGGAAGATVRGGGARSNAAGMTAGAGNENRGPTSSSTSSSS